MEKTADIVTFVSDMLDDGNYKELLDLRNNEKYLSILQNSCCDFIKVVVSKIRNESMTIKPSLYGACEQLLSLIVEKATPEEALLQFIEQIEVAENDAQFSIILRPLQQLFEKLKVKRDTSLQWCLNSINTYIESIPVPEHYLEGKERLLLDSDSNVRRITKVYSVLPHFCKPFIIELTQNKSEVKTKEILSAFLISLLGKPFLYIDLDPESNKNSEMRSCSDVILQDICKLENNLLKLLIHIETCKKENQKPKISLENIDFDQDVSPYEHREKVNMTTLSALFYAIFSDHFDIPDTALPCVYSIEYLCHNVLFCVVHLLGFTAYGPLAKGMSLCKQILMRFGDKCSNSLLSCSVHFELCTSLINIAIYSSYESIRKKAVNMIGYHVNIFEYKGRCTLIEHLLEVSNHSGMIGYGITLYKNSIDVAFKDPELQDCFTGVQLSNMIKKICYLPHGEESDLLELADQIITALNFLRYLIIRDKNNDTGIKDCLPFIENDYFKKLRIGLNMSKAHYKAKLQEIEDGKNSDKEVNVSINIAGAKLDNIPTENKKEILHSALNAFHLIEGLLARLCECINSSIAQ